ncbi:retrovirus-related Pol polyprotein [Turdus rufiventris]|nr:retrovirus-related Pol polyprotein [Turdus rufiventris]
MPGGDNKGSREGVLTTGDGQMVLEAQLAQTLPLDFAVHNIQPGDWVLVKEWKEAPLVVKWRGPFQVLLTPETAVKTAEHGRTHHTRVKVSEALEIWTSQLKEKDGKPRLTHWSSSQCVDIQGRLVCLPTDCLLK